MFDVSRIVTIIRHINSNYKLYTGNSISLLMSSHRFTVVLYLSRLFYTSLTKRIGITVAFDIVSTRCQCLPNVDTWADSKSQQWNLTTPHHTTQSTVGSFIAISMTVLMSNLHETIWKYRNINKWLKRSPGMISTVISIFVASIACLKKSFGVLSVCVCVCGK